MRNLVEHLPRSARSALVEPSGRAISFAELRDQVDRLASFFHGRGIAPGDRVVLLVPMSIELYRNLLALFHLGATAVLVDPSGPISQNLARVSPKAMIGSPAAHWLRLKTPSLRGLSNHFSTGFTLLPHERLGESNAPPPEPSGPDHDALITFTTGTTGRPKCMARTHHRLLAQHHALRHHMDLSETDIDLPTLPVFLLHSLACGATCVIPDADLRHPGAIDAKRVLSQMRKEGVTTSSGSPAFFSRLTRHLLACREQMPGVQRLFMGGARVPAHLLEELAKTFPNAIPSIVYGSTEAEPISVLEGPEAFADLVDGESRGRGILVGHPVPDVMVRIRDGEVCVSGDHVNPAYLDDPDATARHKIHEPLEDQRTRIWHRTGDMGLMDDQGRLWLLGRRGHDVRGVWPFRVEPLAESLSFVERAGLVELDEIPTLGVVLHTPPEDWRHRIEHMTGLRSFAIDSIPVDPRHNAKIDRDALRRRIARAEDYAANRSPSD